MPTLGSIRPATRLRPVVLPQPEWPMSATNSPFCTARSICRSATNGPRLVANVIPTASIWTYSVVSAGIRATYSTAAASDMAVSSRIVEAAGKQQQELLEQQTNDADGEDRNDDVLDIQVVPLIPDPE